MSLGTEKIEAILEDVKGLLIVGKKVKADGKVDLSDLPEIISVLPKLPKLVADFSAISEAFNEGKDLDVAEVVALIQKVNAMVKEVEKA